MVISSSPPSPSLSRSFLNLNIDLDYFLSRILSRPGSLLRSFLLSPSPRPFLSLFRFLRPPYDPKLDLMAKLGMAISLLQFVLGSANVLTIASLLALHVSFLSVGGVFQAFGWELFLKELLFTTAFMVPLFSLNPLPPSLPVPAAPMFLCRWLIFRVMFGSGLIKFRAGDEKWKKATAMNYFYETMPAPNPLSKAMHRLPKFQHVFEVLTNHFVELVLPWFFILPVSRTLRQGAGLLTILFQAALIASGNFSYLNHLAIVPCIWMFDDAALSALFTSTSVFKSFLASYLAINVSSPSLLPVRSLVNGVLVLAVARLSVPVIRNMASKNQTMVATFGPIGLVNSYGAFGVVSEQRNELIISGRGDDGIWREFEWKSKPGDVNGKLKFFSPYHHRLDWCFWLAAFAPVERSPWLLRLLLKLLENDGSMDALMKGKGGEGNPFRDSGGGEGEGEGEGGGEGAGGRGALQEIKVEKWKYEFNYKKKKASDTENKNAKEGEKENEDGDGEETDAAAGQVEHGTTWSRELLGTYAPLRNAGGGEGYKREELEKLLAAGSG